MDSLNKSQQFITQDYDLNLDDILFQYGVRINRNLIEDLECNQIPVTVGMMGDKPQIELRNWFFYPIVSPYTQHPIVKNIDPVTTQFVSTIDTIGSATINKTVLLASSKYSRATPHPARVNLNMMAVDPNLEKFRSPGLPIAVLVEGPMTSIFKGRIHPTFLSTLRDSLKKEFLSSTGDKISKQIIVSDGDIFKNDFSVWVHKRWAIGNIHAICLAIELSS
jgi:ABC-2 type transport system permease protein